MKKVLLSAGVIGTSIISVVPIVACGSEKASIKYISDKATGFSLLSDGDTNIYHTHAIYPWQYMIKHAMLSKNKSIIAPIRNSDTWESFEKKFNEQAFNKLKHDQGLESEVWNVDKDDKVNYESKLLTYVKSHKEEKINVFENLIYWKRIYNLLKDYSNVSFDLVMDGSNNDIVNQQASQFALNLAKTDKRVHILSRLNEEQIKQYHVTSEDYAKISDLLFNERVNGTRLFSKYASISGFDYHDGLRLLNAVKTAYPNKQNLLILGSYPRAGKEEQSKFVQAIIQKFSSQYNIFFKGHPGHKDTVDIISKEINNNIDDITKIDQMKVYILDTFVPSEEFTNNHIDEGMYFDKFISVGPTGALTEIYNGNNGKNTKDDILGMWLGNQHFDGTLIPYPKPS